MEDIDKTKNIMSALLIVTENKSGMYDKVTTAYATGILQGIMMYLDNGEFEKVAGWVDELNNSVYEFKI